jgi:hypothetical protein
VQSPEHEARADLDGLRAAFRIQQFRLGKWLLSGGEKDHRMAAGANGQGWITFYALPTQFVIAGFFLCFVGVQNIEPQQSKGPFLKAVKFTIFVGAAYGDGGV